MLTIAKVITKHIRKKTPIATLKKIVTILKIVKIIETMYKININLSINDTPHKNHFDKIR